jgi:hypothetical protein
MSFFLFLFFFFTLLSFIYRSASNAHHHQLCDDTTTYDDDNERPLRRVQTAIKTKETRTATTTTNTQETSYDVSWVSSKFFSFRFIYILLAHFLDNTLVLRHPLPIDDDDDDGEGRWENKRCDEENTQETSYDVSWACGMFFLFTFSFHFYINNFFLDIVHSFSNNHHPFTTTTTTKGGLSRRRVSSVK